MRHKVLRFVPLVIAIAACTPAKRSVVSPHDPASRQAMLLTSHDLAPGRHCEIVDAKTPLPNVAAVLDTAAIPEYLHQAGLASDTGYAVLSLRYDSTGQPTRERMIEYTVPDSLAQSLRSVIASALLPQPAGAALEARLRIDLGAAPRFRLGKSEYCEPQVIVMPTPPQPVDVASVGRTNTPLGSGVALQYKYTADVSAAGEVLAINFDSTVPPNLLEGLLNHVRHERWKPALDDGMPVQGRGRGSVTAAGAIEERIVPVLGTGH